MAALAMLAINMCFGVALCQYLENDLTLPKTTFGAVLGRNNWDLSGLRGECALY